MAKRTLYIAALTLIVVLAMATLAVAATTVTPLPASDYGISPACARPAPGEAACLALELVPRTAEARARTHPLGVAHASVQPAPSPGAGNYGLRPQDLHSAYALPASASSAQTIAIVDAYNDPTAESDLAAYGEEFGLPACTNADGCFQQVNQSGESTNLPFPRSTLELEEARAGSSGAHAEAERATGWGLEISLDLDAARATCQSCHILLVEARSPTYANLEAAERAAESAGAEEISNSWGGPEAGMTVAQESTSAFAHPGTVITVSAGDGGYLGWAEENLSQRGYAEFPASSPHVVAVGGTRLSLAAGGAWQGESVWNGRGAGGGGCSVVFAAPPWQQSLADWPAVGCGAGRAVADVAAVADPYTGLAVHDTSPICEHVVEGVPVHWCTIGGTSLSSPLIAAVYALAGGAGGRAYPAQTLYANQRSAPASLHDVTAGSNGECSAAILGNGESGCSPAAEAATSCAGALICLAGSGYDGPSGVGTPNGIAAFTPAPEAEAPPSAGAGGGAAPAHAPGPAASAPAPAAGPAAPLLSALTLTTRALIALNRGAAKVSQVAFAFTSSTAMTVRASLARRMRSRGRSVWRTLPGSSLTIAATAGRNTRHLPGRATLARGAYRLTLTAPQAPAQARSMQFQIG